MHAGVSVPGGSQAKPVCPRGALHAEVLVPGDSQAKSVPGGLQAKIICLPMGRATEGVITSARLSSMEGTLIKIEHAHYLRPVLMRLVGVQQPKLTAKVVRTCTTCFLFAAHLWFSPEL